MRNARLVALRSAEATIGADYSKTMKPNQPVESAAERAVKLAQKVFKMTIEENDAPDTKGPVLTNTPSESNEEAIERLARLSELEYERCRKAEAKKLGFRSSVLDKQVKAGRVREEVAADMPAMDSTDPAGDAACSDEQTTEANGAAPAGDNGGMAGEGFTIEEPPQQPLDGLLERAATDPGAPFKPEVVAALAELKAEDAAAYEGLRSELKLAHVRVTALDKLVRIEVGEAEADPTQTDRLIALADEAELFHTPDDTAYADVKVTEHRETWPVKSRGFRRWLLKKYFEATKGAPCGESMQSALSVIEARSHYDGPERPVAVRIGGADGRIYIDLCDDAWRAIEVIAGSWRVVAEPPVRFRRKAGMLPLPEPTRGGSLAELRRFCNVRKEEGKAEGEEADFVLLVSWLLAALRDCGPYPVLIVTGEQGAAKSTLITLLRLLIDPNAARLRALPREDRDLFISAVNAHLLAFDNVSGLPHWISDTLCRLATGGGFAVRALYSDDDEMLFDATRPIALNGISDVVSRPDLADRGLFLNLEAIPEAQRRPDKELMADFERERPAILGALLDAMAAGLKALPATKLARLPRMADFALWATACEGALPWPAGTFLAAYGANRRGAVLETVEADAVGAAVLALVPTGAE
ncbi:MAG: hypothetical protein ACREFZ_00845 [Acetobacteraceae bacterium]